MLSIRLDSSVAVDSPASSRATSGAASPNITALTYTSSDASSTNGTTNGTYSDRSNRRKKQRVMDSCFPPPPPPDVGLSGSVKEEYAEYTMEEIINGRGGGLPGLIETFISSLDLSVLEQRNIASYLDPVERAGKVARRRLRRPGSETIVGSLRTSLARREQED